jgi:hypothetical protein
MHPAYVRRKFTADEVLRMVQAGILAEDEPVELIDGELIARSPQGPRHRSRTAKIHRALEEAFGAGHHVQSHSPISAGVDSLPEPDVAVIRGDPDDFVDHHPGGADVPLVVEVSVTSQAEDRAKAAIYAGAGVREYWNLDVEARRLTVYQEPRPELREYTLVRVLHDDDTVPAHGTALPIRELLPPLTPTRSWRAACSRCRRRPG